MKKKYFLLIILFINFLSSYTKSEKILEEKDDFPFSKSNLNLNWQFVKDKLDNELKWTQEKKIQLKNQTKYIKSISRPFDVRAYGRAVTINGDPFPEISNYVPNAYIEDPQKFTTLSLRGISKVRSCVKKNFDPICRDGVLDLDFNLINTDNFSINPKFNIQSLSDRGTEALEGISMGFKAAKKVSNKWSLAFGGENIIHFDDTVDLGRNFYLIASTYERINKRSESIGPTIFFNVGIGTDFYGYKGNGYLGKVSCFGRPNLTGEGTNNCNVGPIGSFAIAFNDRFAFVNEWFGYGYGSGFSLRPLKEQSLNFSLYVTDYLGNYPEYINEGCYEGLCEARFYGSISVSF